MNRARHRILSLGLFLLGVGGVGYFASLFRPGPWYEALAKPPWTPPDWVFAPVWSVIYVTIAVAGWLIFTRPGTLAGRLLWCLQLLFNGLWSWLFFGLHATALALADLTALLACLVALLVHLAPRQPASCYLLVPYALWTAFAWSLNAGVVALNG